MKMILFVSSLFVLNFVTVGPLVNTLYPRILSDDILYSDLAPWTHLTRHISSDTYQVV